MLCQAWLFKKGVVLTIKDANGIATQYRAHPAMPVQQLKHELSVLPASPFVDGDELRVVSSPTQSRPLNNMEETLWTTDAHGLSVGIFHFVSSNLPTHFVSSNLSSWILPFLPRPELILYVMPGMGQKQAVPLAATSRVESLALTRSDVSMSRCHLFFCCCVQIGESLGKACTRLISSETSGQRRASDGRDARRGRHAPHPGPLAHD